MKPYVEKMNPEAMYAEKSWGIYNVIDVQDTCMTIKVLLNAGHKMKYHRHLHRDERFHIATFFLISNKNTITTCCDYHIFASHT